MQITDETAVWISKQLDIEFTHEDIEKPEKNIEMGCFYLNYLISHYKNTDVALAAYNAGMGNVAKCHYYTS
jgi:soluble lytic murein transglycosylase